MSAVQPANSERPYPNARGEADVIDLRRRRGRPGAAQAGRWNHSMDIRPTTQQGSGQNLSSLEGVADYVERWFNDIERSLLNPETALIYRRTIDVFEHILRGAVAKDVITEPQRVHLTELLDAARQAPDHA